jgi:hypothetical protein
MTRFPHSPLLIASLLAFSLALVACTPSGPHQGPLGETIYPGITGGDHTKEPGEKVNYDRYPPVGGKHASIWQNCGVYDTEIQNETAVHALEHGAVWITYKPSIPESDKGKLRVMVVGKRYRLLSVYASQDAPIIATAWGAQLKLQALDEDKLEKFIERYQGPDSLAPERGAACVGGTGVPRQ